MKHAFQSVFHCKHRIVVGMICSMWTDTTHRAASMLETWHCNGECYLDCANRPMIKKETKQTSNQASERAKQVEAEIECRRQRMVAIAQASASAYNGIYSMWRPMRDKRRYEIACRSLCRCMYVCVSCYNSCIQLLKQAEISTLIVKWMRCDVNRIYFRCIL